LSYRPADTSPELMNLTVGELLRSAVERAPDRYAAVDATDPTRRWTYTETWDISVGIARALLDRHPQGSYIAIWGPTSPEFLFIEFGIALAGMTLVTVNPAFKTDELRHVLLDSGAVGLFMVKEFRYWRKSASSLTLNQ